MNKDRSSHNQNLVDQYLVHCGLAADCKTKLHPDIWHESFVATNTKPNEMTEFTECGVKRPRDTCRVLTPMTFSKTWTSTSIRCFPHYDKQCYPLKNGSLLT
jgi:hypothetical protein